MTTKTEPKEKTSESNPKPEKSKRIKRGSVEHKEKLKAVLFQYVTQVAGIESSYNVEKLPRYDRTVILTVLKSLKVIEYAKSNHIVWLASYRNLKGDAWTEFVDKVWKAYLHKLQKYSLNKIKDKTADSKTNRDIVLRNYSTEDLIQELKTRGYSGTLKKVEIKEVTV